MQFVAYSVELITDSVTFLCRLSEQNFHYFEGTIFIKNTINYNYQACIVKIYVLALKHISLLTYLFPKFSRIMNTLILIYNSVNNCQ